MEMIEVNFRKSKPVPKAMSCDIDWGKLKRLDQTLDALDASMSRINDFAKYMDDWAWKEIIDLTPRKSTMSRLLEDKDF